METSGRKIFVQINVERTSNTSARSAKLFPVPLSTLVDCFGFRARREAHMCVVVTASIHAYRFFNFSGRGKLTTFALLKARRSVGAAIRHG